MFSVRGIKSLVSTLRFRIVFWITLVVLIMVLGVNTFVRELEHRTVRAGYDEYLLEMGEQLSGTVAKVRPDEKVCVVLTRGNWDLPELAEIYKLAE